MSDKEMKVGIFFAFAAAFTLAAGILPDLAQIYVAIACLVIAGFIVMGIASVD